MQKIQLDKNFFLFVKNLNDVFRYYKLLLSFENEQYGIMVSKIENQKLIER